MFLVKTEQTKEIMKKSFRPSLALQHGDKCTITRGGVKQLGLVDRIIRMSNGNVLFRVVGMNGLLSSTAIGLFTVDEVEPVSEFVKRTGKSTFYEELAKYEITGKTTLH